ncbi:AbrB/MazE/SpoVT family DNA-binding domain-containing protein [Salinigranum rubrum]|uniref:AbrB/MazE/SpoVT family DNA-binding domain-containing protein n=1 Tax=Salinigranum rubrum TaxID=755307 RepID=A0A2I8VKN4_9EURY|nr:AbrB/MazE/SpoVT family DNA-binding domain-containing protein [Salinigranum rubrum]AUV82444.1 AbrB/MazE/SpoVT family DNA-binding domain-containing protein [Salinigranum rubrum]
MAKVDSKGRIVLPKEVRERLGITPGTEVDVREENGKAVVEPEDDPEEVLHRMDQLIAEFSKKRGETRPFSDNADPISEDFRDNVRNGAKDEFDE